MSLTVLAFEIILITLIVSFAGVKGITAFNTYEENTNHLLKKVTNN